MPKQLLSATSIAVLADAYRTRIMDLNGVSPEVRGRFNVIPSIEQKLEDKIAETADFLRQINVMGVSDLVGAKLGLGISGPIAGRTNTANGDRQTGDYHTLDESQYRCEKTDFDTHIPYPLLDAWSKFPDFQQRINKQIIEQIARDRLMIGWNGERVAADTDIAANPLLQDVNIGWLKHIETDRPGAFLSGTKIGTATGNDFKNIDAAVYAARHELIAPWFRNDTSLVAIMGSGLIVDKNISMMSNYEKPTERAAMETQVLNQKIGTLKPIIVPFFPEKSVLITSADNLSIYYQTGSRRRTIVDEAKRDRLEDYQSVNEAYVVENFDKCALLSSILQWDGAAWS
ncbi:MAG: phage major capsid protein, P2 family [Robiginitomaculum sp.]|nr:phage major capsid protein, P2 family [Robiginitomaculum sp.]